MSYLTANGHELERLVLHVPNIGPWWADCDFVDESADAVGAAEIIVGTTVLSGTFDERYSGIFSGRRQSRIVAGGNGWSSLVPAKSYHNDAGTARQTIVSDLCTAVGEQLGTVEAGDRLRPDFVRSSGTAASALEAAIGNIPWWVDFTGITHVAQRPMVAAGDYQTLNYNTRDKCATLSVDDINAVTIGSELTDRLDPAVIVRELEITITNNGLKVLAYHSDVTTTRGSHAELMTAIVRRAAHDERLLGTYTYRVIRMSGDRVDLQVVDKSISLPDLVYVPMSPGIAGAHATLTPGAEVCVSFRDGNRSRPIITHFTGKGGLGFVPQSLDLCGNGAGLKVARQGDLVQSGGVGTVMTLWPLTGSPAPPNAAVVAGLPHLVSFDPIVPTPLLAAPLYGAISTGSLKVSSG